MSKKLSSIQTGVAGEYFVAGELSRRGYVASITLRNTRSIDILASNEDATKSVGIQVKTSKGRSASWMLSKKAETLVGDNLFYVFVRLPAEGMPEFYVVPRNEVARQVRESHREWLATPGRAGQQHVDSDVRKFTDLDEKYRDRWDLLGLD